MILSHKLIEAVGQASEDRKAFLSLINKVGEPIQGLWWWTWR
jgi:hypothetical protein